MATVYGELLRNRRYLRYAVALGCVAGVNFSYISGAPFLFIELHGVSPQQFGLFFGANACGLIGASQVNRRLLRRFAARRILDAALGFNAAAGVLLTVAAFTGIGGFAVPVFLDSALSVNAVASLLLTASGVTGFGGFPVQVVLLFVCLSSTGLLYPNVTALAMAPFDKASGSASALLGTIQYSIGASAGAVVGVLHNGTALPMTATMAACAVVGWCAAGSGLFAAKR